MIDISPFRTMELLGHIEARRRRGAPVYRFDLGEPRIPTSARVREHVASVIAHHTQSYTESRGRLELRQAISKWYEDEYGASVDAARIVVTTGASAALMLAVLAGSMPDDIIAVPRPGYPAYRNIVNALGRVAADVSCGLDEGFRLSPASVNQLYCAPSALILASPANPTGTVLTRAEVAGLLEYCAQIGARPICDEIYQGLCYDQAPVTAAEDERAFVVNSFSKFWRMTGWRIGWLICPPDLVHRVDALAQHFFLCPPATGQAAALVALQEADDCRSALPHYKANRDRIITALKRCGVTSFAPAEGAIYVYACLSDYTDNTLALAHRLLEETGVAIAPGEDFDPLNGATWVRLSTTAPQEETLEGLQRLEDWLKRS